MSGEAAAARPPSPRFLASWSAGEDSGSSRRAGLERWQLHRVETDNDHPCLGQGQRPDTTPLSWLFLVDDGRCSPRRRTTSNPTVMKLGLGECRAGERPPHRILDPSGSGPRPGLERDVARPRAGPLERIGGSWSCRLVFGRRPPAEPDQGDRMRGVSRSPGELAWEFMRPVRAADERGYALEFGTAQPRSRSRGVRPGRSRPRDTGVRDFVQEAQSRGDGLRGSSVVVRLHPGRQARGAESGSLVR